MRVTIESSEPGRMRVVVEEARDDLTIVEAFALGGGALLAYGYAPENVLEVLEPPESGVGEVG